MTGLKKEIIEIALEKYLGLISMPDLVSELAGLAVVSEAHRKETIRYPNEKKPYVMCIISGVVRGYFPDDHGRCFSIFFAEQPGDPFWFPELHTMDNCGFDALTAVKFLMLPWEAFKNVMRRYDDPLRIRNRFLQHRVEDQFQHRLVFQIYNATERYLLFKKEYPDLENRIKDEYIADYLGITNVSLSRIRRALRDKAAVKTLKKENADD